MKTTGLLSGIVVFFLFLVLPVPEGVTPEAMYAAGTTLLMAIWWITEAIPIYATALVPLVLFPLTGVLSASETAENYGHNYVLMLLGGFMLAKAIEIHHLHKRIALLTIKYLGTSRKRIIASFMLATAFLSMWIANVAVTLLMLPIATAIIIEEENSGIKSKFGLALMLSIAYAASIGGTGSLVGTPPNMAFAGILEKMFPDAPEVSFLGWMQVGIPVVLVFLPIAWYFLVRFYKVKGELQAGKSVIEEEFKSLGKISKAEKRVLILFILTSMGWIFRKSIIFGTFEIPGWSNLLGVEDYVHDSTVAIFTALLLFMIPAGSSKRRLLTWKEASTVPWGVVLIVGGGYCIAAGFNVTGLAEWIGRQSAVIGSFPEILILLTVVGMMIFLTEINSNTATANIFLPIFATMAIAANVNPLFLMFPVTFACSFSFMLPSGTGTNAVIFGSGRVTIPEMAKSGFYFNLIGILVLTLLMYLWVIPFLEISVGLPPWAHT